MINNLHDLVIAAAELLMPAQGLVIDHFGFAHRTSVLDSRNQSIALPKDFRLEGPGQLAQLFKMSLELRIICPLPLCPFPIPPAVPRTELPERSGPDRVITSGFFKHIELALAMRSGMMASDVIGETEGMLQVLPPPRVIFRSICDKPTLRVLGFARSSV